MTNPIAAQLRAEAEKAYDRSRLGSDTLQTQRELAVRRTLTEGADEIDRLTKLLAAVKYQTDPKWAAKLIGDAA